MKIFIQMLAFQGLKHLYSVTYRRRFHPDMGEWERCFFLCDRAGEPSCCPVPLGREILPVVQGILFFMWDLFMIGFGYG